MQEFPKALYRGHENRLVADKDQQAALEADGWHEGIKAPEPAEEAKEDKPKRKSSRED